MKTNRKHTSTARSRFEDAKALHAIEGNPLSAQDEAMHAMFEREGFTTEERIAYIRAHFAPAGVPRAAE